MANSNPLVSVIIPVYNRSNTILYTLNSVKDSIYRPIEIIIIDDLSTDNSFELCDNFATKNSNESFQIFLYKNEINMGAVFSRNVAFKFTNGKYIQFLDSDDKIMEDKILHQVRQLENGKFDISVTDFLYMPENIKISNKNPLLKVLNASSSLSISTPLFKRKLIQKIQWSSRVKKHQDMDFVTRALLLSSKKISYLELVGFHYNIHQEIRISNNYENFNSYYYERLLELLDFSFFKKVPFNKLIQYFILCLSLIINIFKQKIKKEL